MVHTLTKSISECRGCKGGGGAAASCGGRRGTGGAPPLRARHTRASYTEHMQRLTWTRGACRRAAGPGCANAQPAASSHATHSTRRHGCMRLVNCGRSTKLATPLDTCWPPSSRRGAVRHRWERSLNGKCGQQRPQAVREGLNHLPPGAGCAVRWHPPRSPVTHCPQQ